MSSQQYQVNGKLRVSGTGTFAELFVAPALMAFAKLHPKLSVEMDFNTRMVHFVDDGFDFAIRYSELDDSSLSARKLASQPMAVASTAYLQEHGTPNHSNQLKNHQYIISNNDHWLFHHEGASESVKVSGRWHSNNAQSVVMACEQGLGIAYIPKRSFKPSIAKGCLVPVLEPYWGKGLNSWIVFQNKRFMSIRTRLAIDFLVDHFAEWEE